MNDIIKQVQEACAAEIERLKVQVNGEPDKEYNLAVLHSAAFVRDLDLSHLTGWQDIRTAPKDFITKFDGWNGERVPDVFWSIPLESTDGKPTWCHHEYIQDYGWVRSPVYGLTHWMPLPAPPKPSK